jgi:hypothetical protein
MGTIEEWAALLGELPEGEQETPFVKETCEEASE